MKSNNNLNVEDKLTAILQQLDVNCNGIFPQNLCLCR